MKSMFYILSVILIFLDFLNILNKRASDSSKDCEGRGTGPGSCLVLIILSAGDLRAFDLQEGLEVKTEDLELVDRVGQEGERFPLVSLADMISNQGSI